MPKHDPVPSVPRRPPARRSSRLRPAQLLLPLLPIVLLLVAVAVIRAGHAGEALPGTRVEGLDLDLAGLTMAEARDRLTERADRPIALTGADQRITLRLRDAGIVLDAQRTAEDAVEAGRSGPAFGVFSTVKGVVSSRNVAPRITVDRARLDRATAQVAARIGRRADDGALRVDPTTLEVTAAKPTPGRSVDRTLLARRLRAAARSTTRAVAVPVKVLPAASEEEVHQVVLDAEEYLGTSLTVQAADRSAEVTPAQLGPILRLESFGGHVRLGADPQATEALVTSIAGKVDRPARPPRFSTPSDAPTLTEKGSTSWRRRPAHVTVSGRPRSGREVDRAKAALAIRRAVRAGRHDATLPTKRSDMRITPEAARRVKWLIGTFTTPFVGGQPRVTNITQIAKAVDGTVIAPGEQFSLNAISGQRTKAKGYVEAPFISDGKIVPSVGGGVSQFSTTMYNAAYFAGLQLDFHQPHSLYIDRYPPGREGTLNFPDIDLKWTNDTDTPVVVRTRTGPSSLTVWLYGDNGGRRVRSIAGERKPVPGRDFAITVTREVRYADGRVVKQPYTTTYDTPIPGH